MYGKIVDAQKKHSVYWSCLSDFWPWLLSFGFCIVFYVIKVTFQSFSSEGNWDFNSNFADKVMDKNKEGRYP